MTNLRRILNCIFIVICANLVPIFSGLAQFVDPIFNSRPLRILVFVFSTVLLCIIIAKPEGKKYPTKLLGTLSKGCEMLRLFLVSVTATTVIQFCVLFIVLPHLVSNNVLGQGLSAFISVVSVLWVIITEAVVFWSGMLRVYLSSVQLGIKHRILAALCGFIPVLNIYYLMKIIRISQDEAELETEKFELNTARAENNICSTRYPILMVHGVFFRDFKYLNYWGRIPRELQKNGATIFYGNQQSAASVEDCGKELAQRVTEIIQETGCEKVNIIAHSKGGLDSRAAISHFGAAPYVASLTTINTPHCGCIFADYLLEKLPESFRLSIAGKYNSTLKKLGDVNPDFMAAVSDLTASACLERNKTTPDSDAVFYHSVCSFCNKASGGKFPLNVSYPLVKHFDGRNDGLVAVDSARWGENFTLLSPKGSRGISHGDVIDLNRENIPGFDVREFFVSIVADLKERGF